MTTTINQCGICLDPVSLRSKTVTCMQCEKPVHFKCWLKWSSKCGRCIYCNYAIENKPNQIIDESDEEAEILERYFLDDGSGSPYNSSSDDDWTPNYSYNLRIRGEIPQLRPRTG